MSLKAAFQAFFKKHKDFSWGGESLDFVSYYQGCPTCGDGGVEVDWDQLNKDIDAFCKEWEAKQ